MLLKTIDHAIEQARDLGMPLTVHILMMARIEADQFQKRADSGKQDNVTELFSGTRSARRIVATET